MGSLADLRATFMEPRPDWNAIGPRLPGWFRERLVEIDDRLTLQFMPPDWLIPESRVNSDIFPAGVWAVMRRLRLTGFLFKKWVYALANDNGSWMIPTPATIRLIKMARGMHLRNQLERMDDEFDRSIREALHAKSEASRRRALRRYGASMKRHNFTQHSDHRISVPTLPWKEPKSRRNGRATVHRPFSRKSA